MNIEKDESMVWSLQGKRPTIPNDRPNPTRQCNGPNAVMRAKEVTLLAARC